MSRTSFEPRQLMAAWCRAYAPRPTQVPLHDTLAPLGDASRGEADAHAAWQRWHAAGDEAGFGETEWPWYGVLERARVETLASRHLPGMARNLGAPEALSPLDPTMGRLYRAARRIFGGEAGPGGAILVRADESVPGVPSRPWSIRLRLSRQSAVPDPQATSKRPSDQEIVAVLVGARALLRDGARFAEAVRPLVRILAALEGPEAVSSPRQDPAQPEGRGVPDAEPASEPASEEEDPDAVIERPGGQDQDPEVTRAFPGYRVFDTALDEERPAVYWHRPEDVAALKVLPALDRRRVRQLAHRLQRRLLAARLRHWSFDQEEGRLDSRRLARLVGSNGNHRIFRVENEAPIPDACVTLLVDQSGSMRGARQQMAALAIDLAAHTLELCRMPCEVLGYTTRFGADNPLGRRWRAMGQPDAPGRLNALRHIIYKTAEQPWRRARPQLGLLLRAGFGQENIDGESLDWAARRLARQPQPRKVLVVLSDGSPYDEATVRANGRGYLEDHLHAVVARIESSAIHLVAVGTGQDVGRYYRRAVTLRRPEAVAEVLFDHLGELLTRPEAEARMR